MEGHWNGTLQECSLLSASKCLLYGYISIRQLIEDLKSGRLDRDSCCMWRV